jgi:SAM-dependent methyltransferase
MKIHSSIQSMIRTYHKMSCFGKVLLFITLLLIMIVFFKSLPSSSTGSYSPFKKVEEGFIDQTNFLFKKGPEIYDDFYSEIYDYLVFNKVKNDYEVGEILNASTPNSRSVILDIGCGNGHHVAKLAEQNINVIGIDISPSMIQKARENYPLLTFMVGDVTKDDQFKMNSFTHILCLYFTIYYFKDKDVFFQNCMEWLMPGGFLIVHIVNREKFDPILPPGNPLYVVSPQRYAKERITKTKINFEEFEYTSQFDLLPEVNLATFNEKFKFPNGKVRNNEHVLYMESEDDIANRAANAGFTLHAIIDLMNCAYDHQYLYVFLKPS